MFHGRWCTHADALRGLEGIHVSSVTATRAGLVLGVETGEDVTGCPDCGVLAVGHGRRRVRLQDIPYFGKPVMMLWAKRVRRCPDRGCPQDHARLLDLVPGRSERAYAGWLKDRGTNKPPGLIRSAPPGPATTQD